MTAGTTYTHATKTKVDQLVYRKALFVEETTVVEQPTSR